MSQTSFFPYISKEEEGAVAKEDFTHPLDTYSELEIILASEFMKDYDLLPFLKDQQGRKAVLKYLLSGGDTFLTKGDEVSYLADNEIPLENKKAYEGLDLILSYEE